MEGEGDVPQRVDQAGRQEPPVGVGVGRRSGAAPITADQVDQTVDGSVPVPDPADQLTARRRGR